MMRKWDLENYNTMKKELSIKKIILTLIAFITLWAIITNAWGYSDYIFKDNNTGTYIYGYISRVIWVLPAIFLIINYSDKLKYNKKQLFSWPKFNKSLNLVLLISLTYVMIGMLLNHKGFWFNSEVILSLVFIKYMIVGIVEEVVFRGWGYNSLANIVSHKKATIITTILFILLHWAAYLIKFLRLGTFDLTGIITQSVSALIWGLIFCWLLRRGKTIWNPILAHIGYDLMCVLLLGGS